MQKNEKKYTEFVDFLSSKSGFNKKSAKSKITPKKKILKSVFSGSELKKLSKKKTKNLAHVLDIFLEDENLLDENRQDIDQALHANWQKKYTERKNYIDSSIIKNKSSEDLVEKVINTLQKPISFYPLMHQLVEQAEMAKKETIENFSKPLVLKLSTASAVCLILAFSIVNLLPSASNSIIRFFDGIILYPIVRVSDFGYTNELANLKNTQIDFNKIQDLQTLLSSEIKSKYIRINHNKISETGKEKIDLSQREIKGQVAGVSESFYTKKQEKVFENTSNTDPETGKELGFFGKLAEKQADFSKKLNKKFTSWLLRK